MTHVPFIAEPGEAYHDNVVDAVNALRDRIDPTSQKMLSHLMTLVAMERGAAKEQIRNLCREIDKATKPRGVFNLDGFKAVGWNGKELNYTLLDRASS